MANIKVAVRIRPISEREITITGAELVVHTDGNELSLTNLKVSASKAGDSRKRTRRYGFDYCFNSSSLDSEIHATQEKVYESLGKSALDALFSGFNACLVAYGQSASGKTYTMMGPKNDPGLTPRLCEGLFFRIFEEQKKGDHYETSVSYLEIYNERVRDLLKPSTNSSAGLRVREHPRLGPYVQGLTRHTVSTLGALMSYVEEGTRARKTASTSQNPTSSRSHALLTVSLTSRSENSTNGTTTGLEKKQHGGRGARLHLVDLAGSERAGNSNCGLHRLKEGANINKSLVALGNVISALAERGATGSGPGKRFIPYRDSALTWLLKDALGGNATTIMLATISPASGSYNETAHTLRFAQRAQSVVNRPVVNEDPVSRIIRELRAEISRLTSLLSEKEIGGVDEGSPCCCKHKSGIEEPAVDAEEHEDTRETLSSVNQEQLAEHTSTDFVNLGRTSPSIGSASTLHRRYSSDESLSSKHPRDKASPSPHRFGSLRSLESEELIDVRKDYDCARLSAVSYDRVNALALVDIPTLVAVLINPDDDQPTSAQIEEISSETIVDAEAEFEGLALPPNESLPVPKAEHIALLDHQAQRVEVQEPLASLPKDNAVVFKTWRAKERLVKQESVDIRKSSSLNGSKKFGSSDSFESLRKSEGNGLVQRSYTNLQLDKAAKQSNAGSSVKSKRTWSPRRSTWSSSRKTESGDRELIKRSVPEAEKPSKDVIQQKAKNPLRKQESDSPKRKISKDGGSGLQKEDSTPTHTPKIFRKGSVTSDTSCRVQTPIQRTNRRAEIVAAVTERLYSTKKTPEESAAGCSTADSRSPETTEVKLANATRMKLQEISRKMLAKRRKTCVDTQTDVESTVRVKDTASITDNPKVITQDVAVITDLHENCGFEGDLPVQKSANLSVRRVKEIATLTERFEQTLRCKDVGVLTEDCEVDETVYVDPLPQWNAGLTESSTNTTQLSQKSCSGSQTVLGDGFPDIGRVHRVCCGCHGGQECSYQAPASGTSERSVICITLPDMLSITIESQNTLESKIAVSETTGILSAEEKFVRTMKNCETQTEQSDKSTTTTDLGSTETQSGKSNCTVLNDLSSTVSTRSAACQSDGKTFRIENIFKDPKSGIKTVDQNVVSDLMPDLTEHVVPKTSLKLTNSVGTCFTPETMERSTEIEGPNFLDHEKPKHPKDLTWREVPIGSFKFFTPITKRPCRSSVARSPLKATCTAKDDHFQSNITNNNNFEAPRCTVRIVDKLTTPKIEAEELKSPVLVARTISNSSVEVDSSFSDDSLDPDETSTQSGNSKSALRPDDALCPPDVVAHTKKEAYESPLDEEFANDVVEFPRAIVSPGTTASRVHDYTSLVLGRNSFLPIGQDPDDTSRNETPESEEGRSQFKKKVSFSNSKLLMDSPRIKETRKPKPIIKKRLSTPCTLFPERESSYPSETTKANASTSLDCSTSENSFRDDISSISGSSETIRSGTLYNSDEDSDAQLRKRDESEMKKVRFTTLAFGEREDSATSDSEGCENVVSDEDNCCCDLSAGMLPHSIFASYLDEATAFVHNMNTMKEYVNANGLFHPAKEQDEEYVEYEGCRISLRDDTDEYLKQYEFNVPLETYRNCLSGIAKLESCIEKAVRHDKLLLDKYGIRLESATGSTYGLVDPEEDSTRLATGVDFLAPSGSSFRNHADFGNSVEDLTGVTDEEMINEDTIKFKEQSHDSKSTLFKHLMESATPRRRNGCTKPYFRRSTRMSDLSVKSPGSYSRLRQKYSDTFPKNSQGSDCLQDSKWYANSNPGSPPSSVEVTVQPRDLKIPQCFLVMPDGTGKQSLALGKEYRSDGGTSSSELVGTSSESIDTVASVRNKFRYPGSPRAKLLQLVSERRQIVHRSRNASLP